MKYLNRNFEVYDRELNRTIKIEVSEDGLVKITDICDKEVQSEILIDRETGELFAKALTEFCSIDGNFD